MNKTVFTGIRRRVFAFLFITALTINTNAAGSKDTTVPKLTKIRLGDLSGTTFIMKVALEKGFFKEEFEKDGITVENNIFTSGPPIIEAFAAGELDFGTIGAQPVIQGFANYVPFKVIAGSNYTDTAFKLAAGPKSTINSVKDLAGKRIACGFGTNSHQVLISLLQNAGISEDQVELVNLSDAAPALIAGSVDATISSEPGTSRLLSGGARIITDGGDYGKILIVTVVSQAFLKNYPQETIRVLKVLRKASDWLKDNEEEGVKIGAYLNNESSLDEVRRGLKSRTRSIDIEPQNLRIPLQQTIDFLYSHGFIRRSVDINDLLDESVYRNAGLN
jgi:sulfonate transport system substrate-binding protein